MYVRVTISGYAKLHKETKFSIKDFFSKCDQIRSFLRIWSHLLKKSLMENFIFCVVQTQLLTGKLIKKVCNDKKINCVQGKATYKSRLENRRKASSELKLV